MSEYKAIAIIDDMYMNRPLRFYNDYAPSLRAERGGLKVIEICCVAMRGRYIGEDGNVAQHLEPNYTGCTNSLTTVGKDNLIMEIETEDKNISKNTNKEAISTNGTEISGTIRATYYKNGERNVLENIKSHKGYEGVIITEREMKMESSTDTKYFNGLRKIGVTEDDPYAVQYEDDEYIYKVRIRRLTPRECWRLMNFKDKDFEAASEKVSSTQLYKQAGNSIVKNVLMALFSQFNIKGIKPWNEIFFDANTLKDRQKSEG